MKKSRRASLDALGSSIEKQHNRHGDTIWNSIHSRQPVKGLTHDYYRYPARFPPEFARAVVEVLSDPGETILDPFMGGGTAVVESLLLGRRVVGLDLNPLAVFVSRVKSTPLTNSDLDYLRGWMESFRSRLGSERISQQRKNDERFKNTPWWLRNQMLRLSNHITRVRNKRVNAFLRCALLSTGQWALDCRERTPNSTEFLDGFHRILAGMHSGMVKYRDALREADMLSLRKLSRHRRLLLRSVIGVDSDRRIPSSWLPVRLVVTSPPYPGVHLLYHRWQVRSRRETPAPFAILQLSDGRPPSYFTFGGRSRRGLDRYFDILTSAYSSIAQLLDPESLVVQLVSFSNPETQIDRYLKAMESAGYEEYLPPEICGGPRRRIWRHIPRRKWYVSRNGDSNGGKELLLVHRLRA